MRDKDFISDERAVVISRAVIMGVIVLLGIGMLTYGVTLLGGEPRTDTNFKVEFIGIDTANMTYDSGNEFNSQNTKEIYITGETQSGSSFNETLYKDGQAVHKPSEKDGTIELEDQVLSTGEKTQPFKAGSTFKVVWIPAERDKSEVVVDKIVIPDRSTLIRRVTSGGDIEGDVNINIDGS